MDFYTDTLADKNEFIQRLLPYNIIVIIRERSKFPKDILECFIRNRESLNSKFQFVIKIHPKESLNKFEPILRELNVENLGIIILKDCDSLTLNYFSDFVIGMHSNMVIESHLLGKNLLRVQTGQLKEDLIKISSLRNKVVTLKTELNDNFKKFLNLNDLTIL